MANMRLFDLFEVSFWNSWEQTSRVFAKFNITADTLSGTICLPDVIYGKGTGHYWKAISAKTGREMYLVIRAHETKAVSAFSRRFVIALEDMTDFRQDEHSKDRFVQVMSHEIKNPSCQ